MDDFDPDCEIDIGDRVKHPKFGLGKVVAIKGSGMQAKITVDFDGVGRKMLAVGFANLTKA
jgi:DNA helicase-2/ATP-dependent DNA helicase PcrA